MKRILAAALTIVIAFSFSACAERHYDENNISKLYDKEWIIGKSRDEIEDKYGQFDREYTMDSGKIEGAYYVNYDDKWVLGLPPSYIHDTYFVVFNDEDIAVDAYFAETSAGG